MRNIIGKIETNAGVKINLLHECGRKEEKYKQTQVTENKDKNSPMIRHGLVQM